MLELEKKTFELLQRSFELQLSIMQVISYKLAYALSREQKYIYQISQEEEHTTFHRDVFFFWYSK